MNFLRGLVDAGRISSIDAYVAEALVRRAHEPDIAVALACACLMLLASGYAYHCTAVPS